MTFSSTKAIARTSVNANDYIPADSLAGAIVLPLAITPRECYMYLTLQESDLRHMALMRADRPFHMVEPDSAQVVTLLLISVGLTSFCLP